MTDMTTRDMTTNMRDTTMSTKSRKTMPEEAMKSIECVGTAILNGKS